MKCLTLTACLCALAASAPLPSAAAQATPPAPRRRDIPRLPERAPRALRSLERPQDVDTDLDLELRQLALQDRQLEWQRELQTRQLERQRELVDDLQEQQHELESRPPAELDHDLTPLARLAPRDLDGAFLNQHAPAPWAQGDPADSLYRNAREALNRGDYRRAAQLFNELTRRYPSSSYAYVSTYYEAFSRYRIGTTDELEAADRALQSLASRGTPAAGGWGRDDTDVNGLRTRIRGALAMRGDAGAAVTVEQTARQAGSSCDQEDLMVRVEALNALSQMDAAAALPILKRLLERRDECLVELRRRAIFMLARRADAEATTQLISTAKNDPNVNVRAEAIGYLSRMPGDVGIGAIEDILRTTDDERIQRAAVRSLMSSETPRARTGIRGLLDRKDVSEPLKIAVVDAYSRERSTPDDAAYLRSLYLKAESERLKSAIIGAVARIGGKENQDWLTGLVRNTNESTQLRSVALQRIARSDMPIVDVSRMYDAADSRSLREQLISALGSRKEPEATDKLIDIAKNSTDPEMRRQAIYYLSRKNDPRATKLLMELIEK